MGASDGAIRLPALRSPVSPGIAGGGSGRGAANGTAASPSERTNVALRASSPLEPCNHWPADLQDERGCLFCPLLQCKYDTRAQEPRPQHIIVNDLLKQGLSAATVALQSGLSKRTVERIRAGRATP